MITFSGDSLFNKHFILKGILTIRDIIDEYGVPLSWQDAQQKYSLNSSLIFIGMDLLRVSQRFGKMSCKEIPPTFLGITEMNVVLLHLR